LDGRLSAFRFPLLRWRREEEALSAVAGEQFDSVDLNTSRTKRGARTGELYASKSVTSPQWGEVKWSDCDRGDKKMRRMPKPSCKRKWTRAEFAARFEAEKARQQRRYCDALALWKSCRLKACLRNRACRGDQNACLKRAFASVPHDVQWQARQAILTATPANIGAPERAARQRMPYDFYAETTGAVVAGYVATLRRHG
jgi:hypothetical protein